MFHTAHCNHSCTKNSNHSYEYICNDGYIMQTSLADRIKAIRTAAGDTPAKVGKKVGVSRQAVDKWERGDTENMKLGNLLRFCDLYHVDVEALIRGDGPLWTPPFDPSQHFPAPDGGHHVAQSMAGEYHLTTDERRLLDGFRLADAKTRQILLHIAST